MTFDDHNLLTKIKKDSIVSCKEVIVSQKQIEIELNTNNMKDQINDNKIDYIEKIKE